MHVCMLAMLVCMHAFTHTCIISTRDNMASDQNLQFATDSADLDTVSGSKVDLFKFEVKYD